ncbi:Oidioi.mRNA.OKI2018_I69.XSR.g16526.t1.cds [Oikopleura dioica]|uniref:Oidioi.mRNA.OKI2018_I69.XSR.g16526.t1.cds n=1 Tax=Oikopleura dioica TaxID=34765 RepID=A0ABN7SLH6_OIKDI|nr:Oidioi.mRNA.OKI2018_I69.XSR.g16526.t1.cds [Oikopleura dioica]
MGSGERFEMPKRVTLTLSMGYNFSDTSFGWNGYNEGFTIYYPHFSELIPSQHSSFSLSAGLTPVIDFQNVERTLLGSPYTKCKPTDTSNSYLNQKVDYYRKNLCEFTRLLIDIDKKCHCYPSYIDNITELFTIEEYETENPPCNFFQHAVCVSEIIDHFQLVSAGTCIPACTEHSFKPQSIQYMQVSERRSKDIHEYLNIPDDIYIASMVLKLSDEVSVVYKEQSTYDPSKFIADMGGTAGVVLGLSLLSILKHIEKMYLNLLDKFRSILMNYKLKRSQTMMAKTQTMNISQNFPEKIETLKKDTSLKEFTRKEDNGISKLT